MLRGLVLALVLANAGYFAWTRGFLADYGFAPPIQSEPQHLAQQIRPETMHLQGVSDAPQLEKVEPPALQAAVTCLQAGLFNEQQASTLRLRLQSSLPVGSWSLKSSVEPGRWIIYMGKYASEEVAAKKRTELRQRGLSFEPLVNLELGPGLSLGHFNSQADAERELAAAVKRGVRTAKVVQELPEVNGQLLKVDAADAPLRAKLETLRPQLAGKALLTCR